MEKEILEVVEQALEQKEQEQEMQTLIEKVDDIESSRVSKGEFLFYSILLSFLISVGVVLCVLSFCSEDYLKLEERLGKLESRDDDDRVD